MPAANAPRATAVVTPSTRTTTGCRLNPPPELEAVVVDVVEVDREELVVCWVVDEFVLVVVKNVVEELVVELVVVDVVEVDEVVEFEVEEVLEVLEVELELVLEVLLVDDAEEVEFEDDVVEVEEEVDEVEVVFIDTGLYWKVVVLQMTCPNAPHDALTTYVPAIHCGVPPVTSTSA
jgi:hypothetical protein